MTKSEAVNDIRKALLELIKVEDSVVGDYEAAQSFQNSYERLVNCLCFTKKLMRF